MNHHMIQFLKIKMNLILIIKNIKILQNKNNIQLL